TKRESKKEETRNLRNGKGIGKQYNKEDQIGGKQTREREPNDEVRSRKRHDKKERKGEAGERGYGRKIDKTIWIRRKAAIGERQEQKKNRKKGKELIAE
ncbi:7717_t:CDS:2, partial [Rhizophagus irregularis]